MKERDCIICTTSCTPSDDPNGDMKEAYIIAENEVYICTMCIDDLISELDDEYIIERRTGL